MTNRKTTLLVVLLTGTLALTTSCKEGSFLERRADNFKAHYNRYYNANDAFKRGLNSFEEAKIVVELDKYLNIYRVPTAGSGREFDKVITKCAEILRKHPRSKWVDNSLLLIGKAYFFKNNYVGSEQKFREVISSESPLKDEARFWLGRTLVAAEASEDAVAHLEESLAGEIDKKWRPQLNLLIADLYAQDGEWEQALEKIDAGLEGSIDDEEAGRAQFLKGQILETLERYEEAAAAFHSVRKYKPLYELAYAAQFSRARITGIYLDAEQGLKLVDKMAKDDKHYDNLDHLDFAEAQIYQKQRNGDEALAIYLDMLYPDPSINRPVSGDLRGRVHYSLGELHRDLSMDFVLASMYFDTSATVLRLPPEADQLYTTQALHNFKENADTFSRFRDVALNIERMDSLLFLGTLTDQEFEDELIRIQEERRIAARLKRDEIDRKRAESGFGGGGGVAPRPGGGGRSGATGGSNGFLDHRSEDRIRLGFVSFRATWGERPLVHNWRRDEAVAQAIAEVASTEELDSVTESLELGLAPLDPTAVPRDSLALGKMLTERANARYELGNVLFLSLNMPDSAVTWYQKVIEEDAEEEVALRALYATAEAYAAVGRSEDATKLFTTIVEEHSDSEFDGRAREKLGLEVNEVIRDSLLLAQASYSEAYDVWQKGDLHTAGENMLLTAFEYHTTDVAAQALFASGLIYTELAKSEIDEFDYLDPIPLREDLFSAEAHEDAKNAKEAKEEAEREKARIVEERRKAAEEKAAKEAASAELSKVQGAASGLMAELSRMEQELRIRRRTLRGLDEKAESYEELSQEVTELERDVEKKKLEIKQGETGEVRPARAEELDAAEGRIPDLKSLPAEDEKELLNQPVSGASEGPAKEESEKPDVEKVEASIDPSIQIPEAEEEEEEVKPDYHLREIIPQPFRLIDVYKSVEANFDKTDFAKGARYRREAIENVLAEKQAIIDSLAAIEEAKLKEIEDAKKAEEEAKRLAENPPPDSTLVPIEVLPESSADTLAIPTEEVIAANTPSTRSETEPGNIVPDEERTQITPIEEPVRRRRPVIDEEEMTPSRRTAEMQARQQQESPSTEQRLPGGVSRAEQEMARQNQSGTTRLPGESRQEYEQRMVERMKSQALGEKEEEKVELVYVYTIKKFGSRTSAKRAFEKHVGDYADIQVVSRVLQGTRIFYLASPTYKSEEEASFFEIDLLPSSLRDDVKLEEFPASVFQEYDFKPKPPVEEKPDTDTTPSPEGNEQSLSNGNIGTEENAVSGRKEVPVAREEPEIVVRGAAVPEDKEESVPSEIRPAKRQAPTATLQKQEPRTGLPAIKKGYAVVVSSLPTYRAASVARKELLEKGLSETVIIPINTDGETSYRVAAFVSESKAEADAFLKENKGKTIPESSWVAAFDIQEEISQAASSIPKGESKIAQIKEPEIVEEPKPDLPMPELKNEEPDMPINEEITPDPVQEELPQGVIEEPRRSIEELEAAMDREVEVPSESVQAPVATSNSVSNLQSGWAIIVASKKEMTEAFQVLSDLRARGYKPEIIPVLVNGSKVFRVAAALYANQNDAINALNAGRGATLPADAWVSEFDKAASIGL